MENKQSNEQATAYIEHICELYNVNSTNKTKMYDGIELIQQELDAFFPYDIKVAINQHYKYKSSKIRPNLHQVIAQLTGVENIEKKTKEQIEIKRNEQAIEKFKNFNEETKKAIAKYKCSNERKELIEQGVDFLKLDTLMEGFIRLQAMILNPSIEGTYFGCGLDSEFHRIKPITHETEQYLTYTDYLRSKDFLKKVKNNGVVSVDIPEDVRNHLIGQKWQMKKI